MHMLRRDHITEDKKHITSSDDLKGSLEGVASYRGSQIGEPVMATKGQEMKVSGVLEPF
jgi:hypothetical protein